VSYQETSGIVLKRKNFGEADRILKIFTQKFGLISILAKAVKKPSSKKSGSLELFFEVNLRLYRKTSELFLLTEVAPIAIFFSKDLKIINSAFKIAKILLKLAPIEKPLHKVYQLTREFFVFAKNYPNKIELIELAFQVKILVILGFFSIEKISTKQEKEFLNFLLIKNFDEICQSHYSLDIFGRVKQIVTTQLTLSVK
jgi:DNA repair protein RecO